MRSWISTFGVAIVVSCLCALFSPGALRAQTTRPAEVGQRGTNTPRQPPAVLATPTRETLRQLLSGYEDLPNEATWRAFGPSAFPILVALYNDTNVPRYIRLRAIWAASHYPSAALRTFLIGVARAPRQPDLFVREAVRSLGRAFGAAAFTEVRAFLASSDHIVRDAAVRALLAMNTPEARAALNDHARTETSAHIRELIQ